MRRSLLGALIGAGLVIAATAGVSSSEPALGFRGEFSGRGEASSELIAHFETDAGRQTVTVIDPANRVIGVYSVEVDSGEIKLLGVRNITWDLQMVEFNSGDPLPQDIRSGLRH